MLPIIRNRYWAATKSQKELHVGQAQFARVMRNVSATGMHHSAAMAIVMLCGGLYLVGCSNHPPGYGNFGVEVNSAVRVTGLYPAEKNPNGASFRWTNGDATYRLEPVQNSVPHSLAIKVNAFQPTTLKIFVSGRELAVRPLKVGTWSGEIDVSAIDFSKPQSIELRSDVWTPAKVNGYTRPLGVQVIDLELR